MVTVCTTLLQLCEDRALYVVTDLYARCVRYQLDLWQE
jgi:hypothetical protein